jgi:hypothetical protein
MAIVISPLDCPAARAVFDYDAMHLMVSEQVARST